MTRLLGNKELRSFAREAGTLGFSIELTRRNHLRLITDGHVALYGSGTPSDWRSLKNMRAKMRRCAEGRCNCSQFGKPAC